MVPLLVRGFVISILADSYWSDPSHLLTIEALYFSFCSGIGGFGVMEAVDLGFIDTALDGHASSNSPECCIQFLLFPILSGHINLGFIG